MPLVAQINRFRQYYRFPMLVGFVNNQQQTAEAL